MCGRAFSAAKFRLRRFSWLKRSFFCLFSFPLIGMVNPPENSFHPLSRDQWRAWLNAHHTRAEGIWFISYKKDANKARVEYGDAVEEALSFGWVDSKPSKLDDERSMLWFAPRKGRTGWSRPNKERIERMIALGRMHPAGLAKIEQAKFEGSWTKLDTVEDLVVPDDLVEAFNKLNGAAKNFEEFPRSAKRGILEWILNAKQPQTRVNRIAETARLAQINERANQWKGPKK
jgi:uncharacterized protein YdeI (YjbR/CyaY-like superfamily)